MAPDGGPPMLDPCTRCLAADGDILDAEGRPLCAPCALDVITHYVCREPPTAPSVWLAMAAAAAPGVIALALTLRYLACQ
jgi:hypothetical protein